MIIERISNFRMVRTVSEGDHGALLHAVSDKSGERVAVRVQRAEAASPELEQRWLRAVQVARLLAHPAVVRLIQAGRLPDGNVYLIQEQLPGETLAARLGSRPRPVLNEILRLGRQIATVLVAAHARGIVHSALRPEALQLVPDPEAIGGERVKITDWGYARVPPGSASMVPPAVAGETAAAPAADAVPAADSDPAVAARDEYPDPAPPVPLDAPTYLSPEQCRAGSAPDSAAAATAVITDRVDVYALGVLLFQMAAGQLPFSGRAPSELVAMHIAALPPKLEQRGVNAPAGLSNLVATMLIKDPTARPTMREVEERLHKLAQQQQLAQTMTPAQRVSQQELLRQPPGNIATLQMRVPAAPHGQPRRRGLWALTGVLGIGALVALWRVLGMNMVPTPLPLPREVMPDLAGAPSGVGGKEPLAAVLVPGTPAAAPVAPTPVAAVLNVPTTNAPATNVPTTNVPATNAATTSAATTNVPTTNVPTTNVPTTNVPTTNVPTTNVPTTNAPATNAPIAVTTNAPTTSTPNSAAVSVPVRAVATVPVRPGAAPQRNLRPGSGSTVKAPVRPLPPQKKPVPAKPLRPAQAAAAARAQLLAAQAALDSGDYAQAIEGALALQAQEPQAAAVLLGRAACAVDDLTLVNRAYATLQKRPAALAPVTAECKKQGIQLGVSGQFVRTKTR